ncbi:pentatricopeptide repeat-containing protein At2g28050 [Cannabis sativa]|uniref:pentatricopeptide repeat-containing protein At2g28050 n=1 Tax=Cannabis sativa TaxID=3483 RepID=UPI0029CA4080|nr:pentatricopeptide repeat-containing protein At2g28050 [Cannabis sativa]
MSIRKVIPNLKTVKMLHPPKPFLEILNVVCSNTPISSSSFSSISNLDLKTLHLILSDPYVNDSNCLKLFNFVIKNQSLISFKPDLQAHLTLFRRLVEARNFSQAENLFRSVLIDENSRYPFPAITSTLEILCETSLIKAKSFNVMLKVYSDSGKFDQVLEVFDYMKNNGIEIDGRTCTVHLLTLKKADQVELSLDFLYRMLKSNVNVSEYSLSVVVAGLCWNGEIKRSRELVQAMVSRGITLSTITLNTMLDACSKRSNFVELDLILGLMEKEGLRFNVNTYRILVNGFTSIGKVKEAESLVKGMHDEGMKVETHLYNLIIYGYCRACCMESACWVFDEMAEKNVVPNYDTYLAVISGLCNSGEMGKALEYLKDMQKKKIEVDDLMFNTLIEGFGNKGLIKEAYELLLVMEMVGFEAELSLCNKILTGLCNMNQTREATRLFTVMVKRGAALLNLRVLLPCLIYEAKRGI